MSWNIKKGLLQEFNRRVLEGFQVTPLWHQGFIRDDGRYSTFSLQSFSSEFLLINCDRSRDEPVMCSRHGQEKHKIREQKGKENTRFA